jgi:hypothetical protein
MGNLHFSSLQYAPAISKPLAGFTPKANSNGKGAHTRLARRQNRLSQIRRGDR